MCVSSWIDKGNKFVYKKQDDLNGVVGYVGIIVVQRGQTFLFIEKQDNLAKGVCWWLGIVEVQ
jgi:hypothetical protein